MLRRFLLPGFLMTAAAVVAIWSLRTPASAGASTTGGDDRPPVVTFSHKLHLGSVGAECSACHSGATTSTRSSDNLFDGKPACATCHDVQDTAQCSTCHLAHMTPAKWQQRTKDIRFPHASHVAGPNAIACATCHAGIEEAEGESPVDLPAMATCFTCHNNQKQSNTCELCHSNFAMLIPSEHRKSDFTRNHGYEIRLGSLDVECQTCHTEASCQECHQGSGLRSFTKRDRMTDPNPRRSTQDGPDQTVLQNVHELNYRFTHGIDARAKRTECASCHATRTFCAECHEAGGNITQPGFKPASHLVAGFALIGKGSGGGLHAQEARRDIESCMSCHDVEGQDPTCLTCHTESGPVR
jgi:hypothetical protein